jgi:aarF domain-containing kinase
MRDVENTLEHAFGSKWKDQLELDPSPIGAGCIAQVFKGKLKLPKSLNVSNKDEDVAVKLIHPHVESLVKIDMELLNILANVIDSVPALELLSLGETCRQFGETMKDQLDLTKEARNLKTFAKKFKDESWAMFPKPIDGLVNKNVLVETLMEGKPISEFMKLADSAGEDIRKLKKKLSDLGTKSILKMVFFDNFVHGDLHPGNILVQFTPNNEPKFVFLDCGIVFWSKTEADHQTLVDICLAFMKHDGIKAGRLMIDRHQRHGNGTGRDTAMSAESEDKFCRGIQKMIDDSEHIAFYDHFGSYVGQICDLARDFKVKLDPSYFHVAMALKVVEGVSLSLNKDLDMISRCVPVVVKAMSLRKLGVSKFPDNEEMDDNGMTKEELMKREGL